MEIQSGEVEELRGKSQSFSYDFCDNYVTVRRPSTPGDLARE